MAVPTAWGSYRRWSRVCWALVAGYLPGVAGIGAGLSILLGSEIPAFLVWGGWTGALVYAGNRALAFRCPRCGYPFFRTAWSYNSFARKCVHCGLPKWGERSPVTQEGR